MRAERLTRQSVFEPDFTAAEHAAPGIPAETTLHLAPVRAATNLFDRDFPINPAWLARNGDGAHRVLRMLDIVLSLTLIMFLSPVLAALAIAIKIDSRGPIFFRQARYGFHGKQFRIFKFRSMRVSDESKGPIVQATKNDPRITRIGKFIRRTSLDELPQILNVLTGDMSFVGPRPHPVSLDLQLSRDMPCYGRRFLVRPGLTGLAQVRGHRGEILNRADVRNRILNDIIYVRKANAVLYLAILILTPVVLLFQRKAY